LILNHLIRMNLVNEFLTLEKCKSVDEAIEYLENTLKPTARRILENSLSFIILIRAEMLRNSNYSQNQ